MKPHDIVKVKNAVVNPVYCDAHGLYLLKILFLTYKTCFVSNFEQMSITFFSLYHTLDVLRYKSEGRWFDPRWCRWNFSLT